LAPLSGGPDDVYRVTYVRTREANERFFARYPEDRERCREIVRMLATRDVRLPTGERLTPRRFQAAGMGLGMKSSFDALHYVLEEAFVEGVDGPALSDTVLTELSSMLGFADRPLYAVMHEPCYGQGLATRWSAERLLADFPEFDVRSMIEGDAPFLFTGEMTYPYQFEEDPALVPLREAAHLLAEKDDWPALYDPDRLARNEVPVYAAVYYDDMYVAREYSLATAAAVRNLVPWITNEYEHDGLRRSGTAVIDRLFAMARTGGQA
ncbi:MAG TPA: alpha/beta hydrolase, partial [Actinopolymorphaceae bacterium]